MPHTKYTIDDCIKITMAGMKINIELQRKATSVFLKRHAKSQIEADKILLKGLLEIKQKKLKNKSYEKINQNS